MVDRTLKINATPAAQEFFRAGDIFNDLRRLDERGNHHTQKDRSNQGADKKALQLARRPARRHQLRPGESEENHRQPHDEPKNNEQDLTYL